MIIKTGDTDILIEEGHCVLTKIAPGQQDTVILQLGINLVRIEYKEDEWQITHNQNVAVKKSKVEMISMESIIKE